MSETLGPEPPAPAPQAPATNGRSRALVITAGVLIALFFGLTTFSGFYTDRMWYRSGGFGSVFSTMLWTRVALFAVFGLVMAVVVAVNVMVAYRLRPMFVGMPDANGMGRYRDAISPIRRWVVLGIAAVLAVFSGTSGAGAWRTYLLWRNGSDFGTEDAQFGRDIGFFVFDLPWLHFMVDFAMAVFVVSLLAAALTHYLYGGISLQTPGDRMSGAAQAQLSLLLGLFVLAKGADYWLDRFDLVSQAGGLITGITYTDDNAVLPAKNILLGISIICAVLFFLNVWRRTWMLPSVGIALLALSAILLGVIWPGIVQQFQVNPSEPNRERDYIARNIEATRAAYDLTDVEVEQYTPDATLGSSLAQLDGETKSIPLVDPQVVRPAFEQTQQVRSYYSVADVLDVDRYDIDGTERALVLGVRELNPAGVPDQNWSNLATVYTHGNGIIAAYANQRDRTDSEQIDTEADSGEDVGIEWAQGTQSSEQDLQDATGGFEQQVYYGEQSPTYSVVGKAEEGDEDIELNLPTVGSEDDSTLTTFTGDGDAPVGSVFNKLMFAIKFGEPNFLLSDRVNSGSKVLYDRNPSQRVEKAAPWLTVDSDPYPAVVDGRILWIVDGYTVTDRYPGSERESFDEMTDDALATETTGLQTLPTDEINYMRNAVKATVDAYTGQVTLYEWDTEDPILKAWQGAFPGTVEPREEISDELLDHLRYPEDLFKVQRYQFARYHVTDPGDWYQSNDRWEVPEDPDVSGTFQPPYRVFVDNPLVAGNDEKFALTSVYVPYKKNNLASFVSVNSDAASDEYGDMSVLQLPNEQTPGPALVANQFSSDQDVADALAQFNRSGARVLRGNLLTLPVNDGLMYVQPVYALRELSDASFPILRYVLTKYGDNIGLGTTLRDSLEDLIRSSGITPDTSGTGGGKGDKGDQGGQTDPEAPSGPVSEQIDDLLAQAEAAFEAADKAFADGDLGAYQDSVKEAQDLIGQALELSSAGSGSSAGEGAGDGSTDAPSDSPTEDSSGG
ncbi:hypothetical protein I601_0046 [Nocardioides dokdonensis FR1436]|uniref:UPF0182 protein I601_0046 n=1 Tax=Nocardioides dokdonensis FR1436 TaxID=1300347 RepID=A0A1A9GG51_9ACTN|nr:UPF0182 family protein [Nocardioides dokdonensis]ANH36501.1 hypothetical protein I601_0046 [Nocardioides dokdonensis FR1436]